MTEDLADWVGRISADRATELAHARILETPRCVAEDDVPAGACGFVWYKHHHAQNGGPRRHVCARKRKGHAHRHACPCGKQSRNEPRQRSPSQVPLEVV